MKWEFFDPSTSYELLRTDTNLFRGAPRPASRGGPDRLTCRGDLVPRLPYWLPEEVTWPARSVPGRSAIGGGPWGLPGREPSARPAWCSFWPPEKLGTMRRPEEPSEPVLPGFRGPFGGAGMTTNDDLRRQGAGAGWSPIRARCAPCRDVSTVSANERG